MLVILEIREGYMAHPKESEETGTFLRAQEYYLKSQKKTVISNLGFTKFTFYAI
jgi:hypothetical protein